MELNLGVEGLVCVDFVVVTGAVAVLCELVVDVLSISAALVAVVVVALIVWCVALVGSRGPAVLVGFHEVELGAPVAVDLIGVAVAISVGVHPEGTVVMLARHADEVPGGDAAALVVAEIDIPLHSASQEVGLEVLGVVLVESGRLRDVAAAIGGDFEVVGGASSLGEWGSDVVSLLGTIDLDHDLIEAIGIALLHVEQVLVLLVVVGLGRGEQSD